MDEMTTRGLLALASVPVFGVPLGYLAERAAKGQFTAPTMPRLVLPRLATLRRAFMRP